MASTPSSETAATTSSRSAEKYPRTLLFGNVCCETTLPFGTPQEVERETLELVERLGPSGGILIGSSSEVHDLIPAENALRMYATVHKYGAYAINSRTVYQ